MEVFHWLANLPVRRYRRPPVLGGYLVQGTPRHSCSQRSDDVDPVYWGLLYKLIWEDAERGKFVGPCSCTASVHSCQWRQAEWLDLHVSLNVVVLNSLYACFWVWCSGQTTVSYGKSFCGCFCLGSCPFLCVWFAVSFDETQVWLGDLRVVWLVCVMVGLLWFACISGPFRSLYKWRFYCLCSCKDRATVRHRPYSRKKKWLSTALRVLLCYAGRWTKMMTNASGSVWQDPCRLNNLANCVEFAPACTHSD